MKLLKELFGSEDIKKIESLPSGIQEALCDAYDVRHVGDLPEEGYVYIQVELDNGVSAEKIKSLIATGMGIAEETVDVEDKDSGSVIGEMSVGSHSIPWPLYAMSLLENVDSLLEKHGLRAGIHF